MESQKKIHELTDRAEYLKIEFIQQDNPTPELFGWIGTNSGKNKLVVWTESDIGFRVQSCHSIPNSQRGF